MPATSELVNSSYISFLTLAIGRYSIFAGCKLHGSEAIQVEQVGFTRVPTVGQRSLAPPTTLPRRSQATWSELSVTAYPGRCMVELRRAANPHAGTSQEANRVVTPHFILMRSVTR